MKILGIGEIVWDCLPGCRKLGGAPVNFSFYAKELGAESYPVSAVGNDSLGDEAIEACRTYGLRTDHIQRNARPTSRVLVKLGGCDVRTCHRKTVEVAAYVCACEGAINPLPASISI